MAINPYASVYNRQDDTGEAFVLGKNEAIDDLREHVKGVLSDLARNRIETQKTLNQLGNVKFTGAMNSDLRQEVLPAAKLNLLNATGDYLRKSAADRKYATSPEGSKASDALREAAVNVDAMHTASANSKVVYNKAIEDLNNDTGDNPKYDHDEAVRILSEFNAAPPLSAIRMSPIILPIKPNETTFLEDFKKTFGEKKSGEQTGNIETNKTNPLYETDSKGIKYDKDGKPIKTDFYKNTFEPAADETIKAHPEMVKAEIKKNNFVNDDNSTAEQKATEKLKERMANALPTEHKSGEKFKPTEGDQEAANVGKGRHVNTTFKVGKDIYTSDVGWSFNTKKPVPVTNYTGAVDLESGKLLDTQQGSFTFTPSSIEHIGKLGEKGSEGISKSNLYVIGKMNTYDPKDFETKKDDLWAKRLKDKYGNAYTLGDEDDPDITVDDRKKITDLEPTTEEVENELGVKKGSKTVAMPYQEIQGVLGNTKGIDNDFNKFAKEHGKGGALQKAPKNQSDWNKAWSSLKSGETLVGLDGKTYTKK